MSRKRGLSVEEKRTRMMEFFFEKKDFFQLKELEKQCQKEKGITSMSVKDILTSLVDDGMVDTEKIGTSVYFWAFPSKASQNLEHRLLVLLQLHLLDLIPGFSGLGKGNCKTRREIGQRQLQGERKRKLDTLNDQMKETKKKKIALEENIKSASVGREESGDRDDILDELRSKQAEHEQLVQDLTRYRECDPEVMEQMKEETVVAKEAANRWTDNIFSIKSWIKNKFCFDNSVIDKQFGIPDDFDYLD